MISNTQPPKTKTELIRSLQSKSFDFTVEEIATSTDRQKLTTKIDASIRKSPILSPTKSKEDASRALKTNPERLL